MTKNYALIDEVFAEVDRVYRELSLAPSEYKIITKKYSDLFQEISRIEKLQYPTDEEIRTFGNNHIIAFKRYRSISKIQQIKDGIAGGWAK